MIDYLKDLNGIDIPYFYNEETNKYELNEGSINPLGSNDFHSNNSIETSSLDGEIFVKLLNGFLYSIENNKKYIITCTYEDIDALREYISVLIKLFPPKIANEIQYNDCNAGLDNIRFDIVIMPKQKSDNTFTLKQKGFVIDFSSFGIQDNIPKKYLLADMVEQYGFYDIKTAIAEYANSLKTALDVNKTIRIINNKKTELTDAEVGDYYNLLFNRVTLINESFDEIMQIKTTGSDGEIYDQIISINKVISFFKAQFYDLDYSRINSILEVLYVIRRKMMDKNLNSDVLDQTLTEILLSIGSHDSYNTVRFNLITRFGYKNLDELLKYNNTLNIILDNWNSAKAYFDEFFKNQNFSGAYANVCEKLIGKFANPNQKLYFMYVYIKFAENNKKALFIKKIVAEFDEK